MKKIAWLPGIVIALTLLAFLSVGCSPSSNKSADTATSGTQNTVEVIHDINAQQAFDLISHNPDIVILDVRTPEEYDSGHLENAVNIDYYSSTYVDELKKLDRDASYLVYCRSGARSSSFVQTMKTLDFSDVYNMANGIIEWNADGLPVVK